MLTSADIANLRMAVVHLRATAHHNTSTDALAISDAIVVLINREYQQQEETEAIVLSFDEAVQLPAGSVIRTANGMVCEKDQLGFWGSTTPPELSRRGPRYPAVVLYRPEV